MARTLEPRKPRRSRKSEMEGAPRLPIKLEPVSNGEILPAPPRREVERAAALAMARAGEAAARTGLSRRDFLSSACGAATTLVAMNQVLGCAATGAGGGYALPGDASLDEEAAREALGGDELILDVQTHHVDPGGSWAQDNPAFSDFIRSTPQARCGERDPIECLSRDHYIKEIFLDSDTDLAVLSALPGAPRDNPLQTEEAAATREIVDRLGRGRRLQIHGIVLPNLDLVDQLERMQALVETWGVSAFKLYPPWGPRGVGYWLDDPDVGIPVIERARQLGVRRLAIHKGLPLVGMDPLRARCRDVGVVARRYPDVTFMIYHSGYDPGVLEGPYAPGPAAAVAGIDSLIRSLEENGVPPGSNVYTDLGSTWRQLMTRPTEAAHALGKLLRYVGEDRILWGSDSIWYGSPQDQIMALRAFEIAPRLQEQHGYLALTRERKAKIFGRNALHAYGLTLDDVRQKIRKDDLSRAKETYLEAPTPTYRTYGPRTRRELLDLVRRRGGLPG